MNSMNEEEYNKPGRSIRLLSASRKKREAVCPNSLKPGATVGRPPQSNNAVLPGTCSNSPAAIQMLCMPFSGRSLSAGFTDRSVIIPPERPFRLILALDRISL